MYTSIISFCIKLYIYLFIFCSFFFLLPRLTFSPFSCRLLLYGVHGWYGQQKSGRSMGPIQLPTFLSHPPPSTLHQATFRRRASQRRRSLLGDVSSGLQSRQKCEATARLRLCVSFTHRSFGSNMRLNYRRFLNAICIETPNFIFLCF